MRQDEIRIEDYDSSWPVLFEAQRQVVAEILGNWLLRPVEHIGSTSVPGLPAKPIIDMLAVVDDYDSVACSLGPLREVDWIQAAEPGDAAARKFSLCHPTIERRTHHLHIVEPSWGWPDLLLFRDYLRVHPAVAAEYAVLKRKLATVDDQDRPRYRAAKAPFIQTVLDEARHWATRAGS